MTELKDFEFKGKTLSITPPIQLTIKEYGGFVYTVNDEIELYGSGLTEEEAVKSARELFGELYGVSKKIVEMVENQ